MQIRQDAFVAIEYTLTLDNGEVVDQSSPGEALPFIQGKGHIIPGVEKALEGREAGYTTRISVDAEDGYGPVKPELLQEIPRDNFPNDVDLQPGMVFQASTPQGIVNFHVKEVRDTDIVADFNHPLAGQRLHFDIKVVEVREATKDDIASFECGPECGSGCTSCGGH